MEDAALQRQLSRIEFLLVLAVSCLGGLVFGRDYDGEVFFAVGSFFALGVVLVFFREFQTTFSG
jgi:hypothetical protein